MDFSLKLRLILSPKSPPRLFVAGAPDNLPFLAWPIARGSDLPLIFIALISVLMPKELTHVKAKCCLKNYE